jgi:hypothetical protein
MALFPEAKSVGEAPAKWHATETGRRVAASASRDHYETMQKRNALGDGYEVAKRADTRKVHMDDNSDSPDDEGVEEPWDQRVKALMARHNISEDAAVTMLYRA